MTGTCMFSPGNCFPRLVAGAPGPTRHLAHTAGWSERATKARVKPRRSSSRPARTTLNKLKNNMCKYLFKGQPANEDGGPEGGPQKAL